MADDQLLVFLEEMMFIRAFEKLCERQCMDGRFAGSIHLAIGQEAIPVGVCAALEEADYVAATYRGRPHAIAKGVDPGRVLAEMQGKASGTSGGKGGPMHIGDMDHGVLVANAIVAAGIPVAAGVALRARIDRTGQVVVAFFGEGSTNQGVFFETLNMAALWRLPIIFFCENNGYAEMTPFHETAAQPSLLARVEGLGVEASEVDGNDVGAVFELARSLVERARAGEGPFFVDAHTYRLSGHMVGDPNTYRTKEELAARAQDEPLVRLERRLSDAGALTDEVRRAMEERVAARIAEAVAFADSSPDPDGADAFEHAWA